MRMKNPKHIETLIELLKEQNYIVEVLEVLNGVSEIVLTGFGVCLYEIVFVSSLLFS